MFLSENMRLVFDFWNSSMPCVYYMTFG